MWVAQIVVNHVLCRVIDKRIPSRASCLWTSDPVTVHVRSCKVFTLEFRICMKNALNLTSTVEVYGVSKSGPSANLGELQAPNSSPAWPWSITKRWEPSKPWRVVSPVFGGEPSATPKKTPPFSQSPKKWGSLLEPIETFTACLQLPFQTCPISNPLGSTCSQSCSSIDLET